MDKTIDVRLQFSNEPVKHVVLFQFLPKVGDIIAFQDELFKIDYVIWTRTDAVFVPVLHLVFYTSDWTADCKTKLK